MRSSADKLRKDLKYLTLLAREYPSIASACSEIINLQAILKLPKGTEHFMSDLHGEAEAFTHIMNNASGVIKEKVDRVLGDGVSEEERAEFATLIYYPARKLDELKARQTDLPAWYRQTLFRLIDVCRVVSSKHTRSFVRKRLPKNYAYILDELLHAHFEDHDKEFYYNEILNSILAVGRADDFIEALCELIKTLAVFKLHILGDIFDRGPRPDLIMEQLMAHHSVDIQWGNHDVVWMGAAAGGGQPHLHRHRAAHHPGLQQPGGGGGRLRHQHPAPGPLCREHLPGLRHPPLLPQGGREPRPLPPGGAGPGGPHAQGHCRDHVQAGVRRHRPQPRL